MQNIILSPIAVSDLVDLIANEIESRIQVNNNSATPPPQPFIRGIIQLAKFLQVSVPRAQQLKNSGVFPYWQSGRTVLFDPAKVREAMQNVKTGKVRK